MSHSSYRSPTGEPTYGEIRTCGSGEREAGNGPEDKREALKGHTRPPSTPLKNNPRIESLSEVSETVAGWEGSRRTNGRPE